MKCAFCKHSLWSTRDRRCSECGAAYGIGWYHLPSQMAQFVCGSCGESIAGNRLPSRCACGELVDSENVVVNAAQGFPPTPIPIIADWFRSDQPFMLRWCRTVWQSIVNANEIIGCHARGDRASESAVFWSSVVMLATFARFAILLLLYGCCGSAIMGPLAVLPAIRHSFQSSIRGMIVCCAIVIGCAAAASFTRAFIGKGPTLSAAMERVCFCSAPWLLSPLPIFGEALAILWWGGNVFVSAARDPRSGGLRFHVPSTIVFVGIACVIIIADWRGIRIVPFP